MILISWMTRFTMLGVKLDECDRCGAICRHIVGRKTRWAGLFYLPLVLLGFEHGMACTACGAWTGIGWQEANAATKTGVLRQNRARPHAEAVMPAAEDQPPLSPLVFDEMTVNPKRGPWDLYLKLWPMILALVLVTGTFGLAQASRVGGPMYQPAAHTCWEKPDGSISGCRMSNGSVQGVPTQTTVTCYFDEPLPEGDVTLSCR